MKGILPPNTKLCRGCGEVKPFSEFGRLASNANGLSYRCKACNKRHQREWATNNPDVIKAQNDAWYRRWREQNPAPHREPLTTSEGRLCRGCNTRKSPDLFSNDSKVRDGKSNRCRVCAAAHQKKWNAEHPFRIRMKGFSNTKLKSMWDAQDGLCAICKDPIAITGHRSFGSGANVDHCHKTGAIRELLCRGCNVGLGGFRDSLQYLQAALLYLKKHSS